MTVLVETRLPVSHINTAGLICPGIYSAVTVLITYMNVGNHFYSVSL